MRRVPRGWGGRVCRLRGPLASQELSSMLPLPRFKVTPPELDRRMGQGAFLGLDAGGGGWSNEGVSRVQVMTDALASQVAAGEVVERPSSVVKELVENSLDAGAGEVRLDVQRGGVAMLRVADDGCGMDREDALLSIERHATSKLRDKEGLMSIRTLGFRGEALPSIASVSRFGLTTREHRAVEGTEVTVEGGTLRDVRSAGCPPGTTVEVRDLFFNVPARRKFLRREATEGAHIDHQVRLHALASEQTRFVFRKDGRVVIDVAGTRDRRVRIGDLFGREVLDKLEEVVAVERAGAVLEGYLLPTSEARTSRRGQYLFLNGRPVEDRVVWRALEEGYRGALPAGRHPVAWLWIEMDPALVDVNVHPAKREVRFHRPAELRSLIYEAVVETLRGRTRGAGRGPEGVEGAGGETRGAPAADRRGAGRSESDAAGGGHEERIHDGAAAGGSRDLGEREEPRRWRAEAQPELPGGEAECGPPSFRPVGVLNGRYVVLESGDGMVLMEGEAAWERILYERLLRGAEGSPPDSQGLLVPVLVELDARDADVVFRNLKNFQDAGMEVESFGGVTVQLRSLPAMLAGTDPRTLLVDLVDQMVSSAEGKAGRSLAFERFAGQLAAVGARGRRCRTDGARRLVEDLLSCDLPYCTPDGRPTIIQVPTSELERRFGQG